MKKRVKKEIFENNKKRFKKEFFKNNEKILKINQEKTWKILQIHHCP